MAVDAHRMLGDEARSAESGGAKCGGAGGAAARSAFEPRWPLLVPARLSGCTKPPRIMERAGQKAGPDLAAAAADDIERKRHKKDPFRQQYVALVTSEMVSAGGGGSKVRWAPPPPPSRPAALLGSRNEGPASPLASDLPTIPGCRTTRLQQMPGAARWRRPPPTCTSEWRCADGCCRHAARRRPCPASAPMARTGPAAPLSTPLPQLIRSMKTALVRQAAEAVKRAAPAARPRLGSRGRQAAAAAAAAAAAPGAGEEAEDAGEKGCCRLASTRVTCTEPPCQQAVKRWTLQLQGPCLPSPPAEEDPSAGSDLFWRDTPHQQLQQLLEGGLPEGQAAALAAAQVRRASGREASEQSSTHRLPSMQGFPAIVLRATAWNPCASPPPCAGGAVRCRRRQPAG